MSKEGGDAALPRIVLVQQMLKRLRQFHLARGSPERRRLLSLCAAIRNALALLDDLPHAAKRARWTQANERALAGSVDNFLGAAVSVADVLSHCSSLARLMAKETPAERGLCVDLVATRRA